jgi:dihydrofolate reductase
MKVSIVVAASDNHMIGKDNQLLWHLPKDMKFFKDTTWAMPVVMGRKTFESLGQRVLPGRLNIILSKQVGLKYDQTEVVSSIAAAIALAEHLTLVTRNTQDFEGIEGLAVVNPWLS